MATSFSAGRARRRGARRRRHDAGRATATCPATPRTRSTCSARDQAVRDALRGTPGRRGASTDPTDWPGERPPGASLDRPAAAAATSTPPADPFATAHAGRRRHGRLGRDRTTRPPGHAAVRRRGGWSSTARWSPPRSWTRTPTCHRDRARARPASTCTTRTSLADVAAPGARTPPGAAAAGRSSGTGWDEGDWPERPGADPRRARPRPPYGGSGLPGPGGRALRGRLRQPRRSRPGLRGLDGWDDDGRVEREAHHAARDATRAASRRRPSAQDLQRTALQAAARRRHRFACTRCPRRTSEPRTTCARSSRSAPPRTCPTCSPTAASWSPSADEARDVAARLDLPAGVLRGLAGNLVRRRLGRLAHREPARGPTPTSPGIAGNGYLDVDQVRDHVVACTQAGLQAGFHVIGDAAVDVVVARPEGR